MENQTPENKEKYICPKCLREFDEKYVFCPKCGIPMNTDANDICPKCGAIIGEDDSFCMKCGTPRSKPKAIKSEEKPKPSIKAVPEKQSEPQASSEPVIPPEVKNEPEIKAIENATPDLDSIKREMEELMSKASKANRPKRSKAPIVICIILVLILALIIALGLTVYITSQNASVSIAKDSITVDANDNNLTKISCTVSPSTALLTDVEWSSSDESIAIVESDGTIRPMNLGKCTITAKSEKSSDTVEVVVNKEADLKSLYNKYFEETIFATANDSYTNVTIQAKNRQSSFANLIIRIGRMNDEIGIPDEYFDVFYKYIMEDISEPSDTVEFTFEYAGIKVSYYSSSSEIYVCYEKI